MKSIKMIIITIVINMVIIFPKNGIAQNMVLEAKQNLLNKKAELLIGKDYFQNRIESYKKDSKNTDNQTPINVLQSAIDDENALISKIDTAILVIDKSGFVNEYSNNEERKYNFKHNNNKVDIYKRVSDNKLIIKLNENILLEGDQINSNNNIVNNQHIDNSLIFQKEKKSFKYHFGGIFIGINGFLNSNGKCEAPSDYPFFEINETRSLAFDIYAFNFGVPFSNFCGLVGGLDLQFNHYSFDNTFDLAVENGKLIADYDHLVSDNFKRFNYRLMYLSAPLLIEFQFPTNNNFYISGGILGGIRIGSRTKQIYNENSKRQKNTNRKTFETNLFKYSFIGGVGYKSIQIFGEYSPISIFKKDHGPEIRPYSIGLKIDF